MDSLNSLSPREIRHQLYIRKINLERVAKLAGVSTEWVCVVLNESKKIANPETVDKIIKPSIRLIKQHDAIASTVKQLNQS